MLNDFKISLTQKEYNVKCGNSDPSEIRNIFVFSTYFFEFLFVSNINYKFECRINRRTQLLPYVGILGRFKIFRTFKSKKWDKSDHENFAFEEVKLQKF